MSEVPDKTRQPSEHILCVSYNRSLLFTRTLLLEGQGYRVTPAVGSDECMAKCHESKFDLLILGHSIPDEDQQEMMKEFRRHSPSPVLSLRHRAQAAIVGPTTTHFLTTQKNCCDS
jgi:CheY-like chemotaxis protein